MIKKLSAIFLVLALALSTSCSKKEPSTEESRTVSYNELGLTYTTPDEWREFEETNLYPYTYTQDGVFAVIDYSYVTEDDYDKYISREIDSLQQYLFTICKIAVVEENGISTVNVESLFSDFENIEKAASQDNFSYYVISGYNGSLDYLGEKDLANYEKMASAVPKLIESVETFPFDSTLLQTNTDKLNSIITFISKTLEGDDINSSIFAEYDLTLLNFWGTNAYPGIDEHAVLQEVYEWIEDEGLNVNIIMAVTDTPDKENEKIALKAKNDANAKFTSLVLDETLAKWVVQNINGIPTTVLVNNEAMVISDKVEGTQDAEFYKDFITYTLDNLN